ncbi:MAG TPA: hypothetical protein PK821_04965 [Victivallales bacterium]|nr:hypothetical protein [Victivallales bacterium]
MKKIKVLGDKIIEKLISSFRSGKADSAIPQSYDCKKFLNWQEINCPPLYFYKNWDAKKLPTENGASFLFHDGENITMMSVMEDSDVYSDAQPINDRTWEKGDILEFFIRPPEQERYYELHVAPNLASLQISIPKCEDLLAKKYKLADLFFDMDAELGAGIISTENFKGWWGLISVPAKNINIDLNKTHSATFTVCRYNYWRKVETPECSSSAPLTQNRFHSPHQWQTLIFK